MRHEQERSYENVVMFVGTTPNNGTTACAFSTAVALARGSPNASVAFLCLNLKSSKIARYLGLTETGGLGAIRANLKAQTLTEASLSRQTVRLKAPPNLYVLDGNMQREQAELYAPDDIEHLLHVASHAFDVCIADCNAYWDNAATVVTAMRAGVKLLVTSPSPGSFCDDYRGWLVHTASLFGITPDQFQLVVSEAAQIADAFHAREIEKSTGLEIIGNMPYDRRLAVDMQLGRLHEWCAGNPQGMQQMERIAARIAERLGIDHAANIERRAPVKLRFRGLRSHMEVNS